MLIDGLSEGPLALSISGTPGRVAIALSAGVEGVVAALALRSSSSIQALLITRTGRLGVTRFNHSNGIDVILTLV